MEILNTALLVITVALLARLSLKSKPRGSNGHKVVIDTSTLMDGRVLDLAKTGFLRGQLIVPSSVVMEMQQIADGTSTLKRERARLGLDVLKELQSTAGIVVTIVGIDGTAPVDDTLRILAKRHHASLMTNDFNLAKVAVLEGTTVLNINELAQALRPVKLPGEHLTIKIVNKGAERGQGVGYLDDGTMVVVDNAANRVGSTADLVVTRTLQTAAGKMCFADLLSAKRESTRPPRGPVV